MRIKQAIITSAIALGTLAGSAAALAPAAAPAATVAAASHVKPDFLYHG